MGIRSTDTFRLEALEARVMLSGEGLSSALATPGVDSEIRLFQDTIPVEVASAAPCAVETSLSYNPQDQLDAIFDLGAADQASDETKGNEAQTSAREAGPVQTSDPAPVPAESTESAVAETGNLVASADPIPASVSPVAGTDGTISNPQVEQLTETLRSANSPPAVQVDSQIVPVSWQTPLSKEDASSASATFEMFTASLPALSLTILIDGDAVTFSGTDAADAVYLRATGDTLEFSLTGAADSYSADLDPVADGIQSVTLTASTIIAVNLGAGDDSLIVDASLTGALDPGSSVNFDGGEGTDSLVGPAVDCEWSVTGAGSGMLNGQVNFQHIENLTGAAGQIDQFVFGPAGRLAGMIEGGEGGFDSLAIQGGNYATITLSPTGPDSGSVALDGSVIVYGGLEPITTPGAGQVVFNGTSADDNIEVGMDPTDPSKIKISGAGETTSFPVPTESLTIYGGEGADAVSITRDLLLPGASLTVHSETITVSAGVTVSTRQIDPGGNPETAPSIGDSGDIEFQGRTIMIGADAGGNARLLAHDDRGPDLGGDITMEATDSSSRGEQWWLISPLYIHTNTASVSITSASIQGRAVTVTSTAENLNPFDGFGDNVDKWGEYLSALIDQIPGLALSAIVGVSGQIVARNSTATVSVTGSTITSSGALTIGSSADANGSLNTVALNGVGFFGKFAIAFGYGQAFSRAETTIDDSTLTAGRAVGITSSARTKAAVQARTNSNLLPFSTNPNNWTVALAVANTNEFSHVTITDGSTVTSRGGGLQIGATGEVTNFAWAQPTINDDGTIALGFAVNFDKADIKTRIDGVVDAFGELGRETFDANVGQDVDYSTNTIRIPNHGFVDGQQALYSNGGAPSLGGLEDGKRYFVQVIDANTFRLANAATIDLDYTDPDPAVDSLHSLGRVVEGSFESEGVNPDDDTITFTDPHGFQAGEAITYLGPYGNDDPDNGEPNTSVGGLEHGLTYLVDKVNGQTIRLLKSANENPVDLTDKGTGRQGFLYQAGIRTFAPEDAVNAHTNTITFAGPHGFQTGDAVLYSTDPNVKPRKSLPPGIFERDLVVVDSRTLSLKGDQRIYVSDGSSAWLTIDGQAVPTTVQAVTFDADAKRTNVTFQDEVVTAAPSRVVVARPDRVEGQDAPVEGLSNGGMYYVVRVDETTVRLVISAETALAADAIDLQAADVPSGTNLGDTHVLQDRGFRVYAELKATNIINASSTLTGEKYSWMNFAEPDRTLNEPEEWLATIFSLGKLLLQKGSSQNPAQPGSDFGAAGSIAVNYASHTVETIVGPTGRLASSGDLEVVATIAQSSQLTVMAGASKPKEAGAEKSIAVAIGFSWMSNTAKATVEGGAQLDAHGLLTLHANVSYPLLIDKWYRPFEPFWNIKQSGPDSVGDLLDGALGYASNLFNTYVMTSADNAKVSGGGAVAINIYDNQAEARIKDGAWINQSLEARFRAGPQRVEVKATTDMSLVGVVGVAGLSLSIQGAVKSFEDWKKNRGALDRLKELVNPFGAQGGKDGIGASFLLEVITNHTEAVIENRAKVHAGTALDVTARTDLFDFAFAEAGGSGSNFALAGAISVDVIVNNTWARIDPGATVDSLGSITVDAHDDTTRIAITGGVVAGKNKGVGIAVSVTVFNRETLAFVGPPTPPVGSATGSIVATDALQLTAKNEGSLLAFSLAGSYVSGTTPRPEGTAGEKPVAASKPSGSPEGVPTGTMLAGSGDVSWNDITDRAYAYIVGPTSVQAGRLDIEATNITSILAISGSVAISVPGARESVGIAGALATNVIRGYTHAYVQDATLTVTGSVRIIATTQETIRSITASGSGAFGAKGIAVAGSVSINVIRNETFAYVSNVSTATAVSTAEVSAKDTSFILAVSGALQYGGKAGVGLSFAWNDIANATKAYLSGSDVGANGTFDLKAENDSEIIAVTAAIGLSLTGMAFEFSISINLIDNDTLAYIDGRKTEQGGIRAGGALSLTAKDTSRITAVAGAVAVGGGGAGFGGSFSWNDIRNTTEAYFTGTSVTTLNNSAISLQATDLPTIICWAIGGAVVGSQSGGAVAVGLAFAVDIIDNDVRAYIKNSTVTGDGTLKVSATSTSRMTAYSVGVAVTAASGGTFSLGGAFAFNTVRNTLEAYINQADGGSTQVTAAGNITVEARDDASAKSYVGSLGIGIGGSGSASVGVSVATNTITNTVTAFIDAPVTSTGGSITVYAYTLTKTETWAGAASVAGGSTWAGAVAGGLAFATVDGRVNAYLGPQANVGASNGTITVRAELDRSAEANAGGLALSGAGQFAAAAGGALARAVVGTGDIDPHTNRDAVAFVQGTVTQATGLTVEVKDKSIAEADAAALSGGIGYFGVSVNGTDATAKVLTSMAAYLQDATVGTQASPLNGDVIVRTLSETDADADGDAWSISFSLGAALAGSWADATATPNIATFVAGSSTVYTSHSARVESLHNYAYAENGVDLVQIKHLFESTATSPSIGLLAGSGAWVDTLGNPTLDSYIGSGATVQSADDAVVLSLSFSDAKARADTYAIGIGYGDARARAEANGAIKSHLDGTVRGDNVHNLAAGFHRATAEALAFSLAASAVANAKVSPKVHATVGANAHVTAQSDAVTLAILDESVTASKKALAILPIDAEETNESKPELKATIGAGASVTAAGKNIVNALLDSSIVQETLTLDDLASPNDFEVQEGDTTAVTFEFTAEGGETATFQRVDGADVSAFELGATSGVLTFKQPAALGGDADQDSIYEINVRVDFSGGGSVAISLRVRVVEASPSPLNFAGPQQGLSSLLGEPTSPNVVKVNPLGARYARIVADSENLQTSGPAPLVQVSATVAPTIVIDVGTGAELTSGSDEDVVILVQSNHRAYAKGGGLENVSPVLAVVDAQATVGGSIEVYIGGTINHGGSLTLELHTANEATAIGEALAVGPVGGTGVRAQAKVTPTISTYVAPGSNITVGGNFTVRTLSEGSATAEARGIAGGVSFAVGVSLAEALVQPSVSTYIGDGAIIQAGGAITIETLHNYDIAGQKLDRKAAATAQASAGSLTGTGSGASASAEASPLVQAYVGSGVGLTSGAGFGIRIRALSNNVAETHGGGLSLALGLSVGAALASSTVGGSTLAYVGEGATLTAGSSLAVQAQADQKATAEAKAVAGGVLSGAGADTSATVAGTVAAHAGQGAQLHAIAGTITLVAVSIADADAQSSGITGGALGIGVSLGAATIDNDVSSYLDRGVTANAAMGDVVLRARHNVDPSGIPLANGARASATASGGGLISGNGGRVDVASSTDVSAFVKSGSTVTAGNDILIQARSNNKARGEGDGNVIGLAGVGAIEANVTVSGATSAWAFGDETGTIAPDVLSAGRDVRIVAEDSRLGDAFAEASAGGLLSGSGAATQAQVGGTAQAYVGNDQQVSVSAQGTIAVDATANVRSKARSLGSATGALSAGVSEATASSTPNLSAAVGTDAVLNADIINVQAVLLADDGIADTTDYSAWAEALSSSGSLVGGSGAEAQATSIATLTATVADGAHLTAATLIEITSSADNSIFARADGDNEGLITGGSTEAAGEIRTSSVTLIGKLTRLTSSDDLAATSRAKSTAILSTEGGAGKTLGEALKNLITGNISGIFDALPSVAAGGGSVTKVIASNLARTKIDDQAELRAVDDLMLEADSLIAVDARSNMTSKGVVASSATAVTTVQADSDAVVEIGTDVILDATDVVLSADNHFQIDGRATSTAAVDVAGAFSTALSRVNVGRTGDLSQALITIGTGTDVTGRGTISISARSLPDDGTETHNLFSRADARSSTGILATASARAEGTIVANSDIRTAARSTLTTNQLSVEAMTDLTLSRGPNAQAEGFITKVVRVVTSVVRKITRWLPWPFSAIVNWIVDTIVRFVTVFEFSSARATVGGTDDAADDSVTLDGDVFLGGAANLTLVVDRDGNIVPGLSNLGATIDGTEILVDPIVNQATGSASVSAPHGLVGGNATFHVPKVLSQVRIENFSNRDLLLQSIDTISDNLGEPDTVFTDKRPVGSGPEFRIVNLAAEGSRINVINHSTQPESDIVFTESIDNVNATFYIHNAGGDIRVGGASVFLRSGDAGAMLNVDPLPPIAPTGDPELDAINAGYVAEVNGIVSQPFNMFLLADGGRVGSSTQPMPIRLTRGKDFPDGALSTIAAALKTAAHGDVFLNISGENTRFTDVDPNIEANGIRLDVSSVTGQVTVVGSSGALFRPVAEDVTSNIVLTGSPALTFSDGVTSLRGEAVIRFADELVALAAQTSLTFNDGRIRVTGAPLLTFEGEIGLSGTPLLDFVHSQNSADLIVRSTGSWLSDGFRPGQTITVSGTANNNGTYEVSFVSTGVLTLADDVVVTPEEDVSGATITARKAQPTIARDAGSWIDDGFAVGQEITIAGATANAGTYHIAVVAAGIVTLSETEVLINERDVPGIQVTAPDVLPTIARSAGDWLDEGFRPGQTIHISGTGSNDGTFTLAAVSTLFLSLTADAVLTDASDVITAEITTSQHTISRDQGSWLSDGFKIGQTITVAGAMLNNGAYTIATVTAGVLTLAVGDTLVNETVLAGATIRSSQGPVTIERSAGNWQSDGFAAGQTITVSGTTSNAGTYGITSVTDLLITLDPATNLNDETTPAGAVTIKADALRVESQGIVLVSEPANAVYDLGQMTLNSAYLLVDVTGDLNVGAVHMTNGTTRLIASGWIADGNSDASANISARNVELTAQRIGLLATPLAIDLQDGSQGTLRVLAAGDVNVVETSNDLRLDRIVSGTGIVRLHAPYGSILDNQESDVADIVAPAAVLNAASGVGTALDPIETTLARIEASTGGAGLWIDSTSDLQIGGVSAAQGVSAAGTIHISSASALTVAEPIFGTSGSVYLRAATSIVMANGTWVDAAAGDIDLQAGDNIILSLLQTTGAVNVASTGGSILDTNDAGADDIVAVVAVVRAGRGIGLRADPVETTISMLSGNAGAGGLWLTNQGNLALGTAGPVTGLHAEDEIRVSTTGVFIVGAEVAAGADVELVTVDSGLPGQDLYLIGDARILSGAGNVALLAGDTLETAAGSVIIAARYARFVGDHGDSDPGMGTTVVLRGAITAGVLIEIRGGTDRDNLTLERARLVGDAEVVGDAGDDHVLLFEATLGGKTRVFGDVADTASDGNDFITVTRLASLNSAPGGIRDTLLLDGEGGIDTYVVDITGGMTDYRIDVFDSGTELPAVVRDTLTINGTETQDDFLGRGSEDSDGVAFVAALHGTPASRLERVNYNGKLEHFTLDTGMGDDRVTMDDTWTAMTIRGGSGQDRFQIGQIFQSPRQAGDRVSPGDEFETVPVTRGFLSNGVSFETTVEGGEGADEFVVFRNQARLELAGQDGPDLFIVRSFAQSASGDNVLYATNAPVHVQGGDGSDLLQFIGTEFGDRYLDTAGQVQGTGRTVTSAQIEIEEVDSAEGDDTFFAVSTEAGVITRFRSGLGDDSVHVGGDIASVSAATGAMIVGEGPHTVAGIQGLLEIDGSAGQGSDGGLDNPVMLPDETNLPPAGDGGITPGTILNFSVDEDQSFDSVTIFNDGSTLAETGLFTATNLTGLGMGPLGIRYAGLEAWEVLLGTGVDHFTVAGTADGMIMALHGGGGSDQIAVQGRGGVDARGLEAPLVIFGDTSQDGSRYTDSPDSLQPGFAYSFAVPSQDTIDASASIRSVVIYGGADDDILLGSQAGDHIAGGSADDEIRGHDGHDHLYGDSGFNLNVRARLLTVPTLDQSVFPSRDTLLVGSDRIFGDNGDDIILGDHGVITQSPGTQRILTTGNVIQIQTAEVAQGRPDELHGGLDADVLFGGGGPDRLSGEEGPDVLLGDSAAATLRDGMAVIIESTYRTQGDTDTLFAGAGEDVLIGGAAADMIDGGESADLIFGDNVLLNRSLNLGSTTNPRFRALLGTAIYDANGNVLVGGTWQADPRGTPVWADWDITLLDHSASDQTTGLNHFGDDYIAGGPDDDMIFGGLGNDVIQGDASIDSAVDADPNTRPVAARRALNGNIDLTPALSLPSIGKLVLVPSTEAFTDGDDYIEGNGGNDVIFGNLGQDDIVGGSSGLFSLAADALRPDGDDIIFGGAGTRIGIHADIAQTEDIFAQRHSRDSDSIAADNANIYRLVGTGAFLQFEYDKFSDRGPLRIAPRAVEFLDYTPGGPSFDAAATNDIGGPDEVHGESGDDFIYGMKGNDAIFGDSQDDDLIGGWGHDWISGGTGRDGALGDDGRIFTSRNGAAEGEPLYGIAALPAAHLDLLISSPGNVQQATINVSNALKKTVDLTPFNLTPKDQPNDPLFDPDFSDDVIYGGLDSDFLHGGAGDDAISGAEALPQFFVQPSNPGNILRYNPAVEEFADYDEDAPRTRLTPFLLNFDASNGPPANGVFTDGDDAIFGDLGNDWIVGGTGQDTAFGGWGDDLINMDDDHGTHGGLNDQPDTNASYEDRAYGGAGRDVLIANTGGDRLIDWVGEFNSYITPFAPFGLPTVSRALQPQIADFLQLLSASLGADPTRAADDGSDATRNGEPFGELGLVLQGDAVWQEQTGAPADPQAGNLPGGKRDVLRSAAFDGTQSTTFSYQSGAWKTTSGLYETSPAGASDQVSLMLLGDQLPSYAELVAIANTNKAKTGVKSNAYLIFDYRSATDFKFAGIDTASGKVEIGHRDATGWNPLAQSPLNLSSETDYQIKVVLDRSNVTLQIDGVAQQSYKFGSSVAVGMIGVGASNSVTRFDNVTVLVLPPPVPLTVQHSFTTGVPVPTATQSGQWQVSAGKYQAAPSPSADAAITTWRTAVDETVGLRLQSTVNTLSYGGLVFDYQNEMNFKFAGILATTHQIVLGHRDSMGWSFDAVLNAPVRSGVDYRLSLSLRDTSASLYLNEQKVLNFQYGANLTDGYLGLFSLKGSTLFDDLLISAFAL